MNHERDKQAQESNRQIINAQGGGKLGKDRPEGWDKVGVVLVTLLEAAIAGGLPKDRAEAAYDQIMSGLVRLRPEAANELLSELDRAIRAVT